MAEISKQNINCYASKNRAWVLRTLLIHINFASISACQKIWRKRRRPGYLVCPEKAQTAFTMCFVYYIICMRCLHFLKSSKLASISISILHLQTSFHFFVMDQFPIYHYWIQKKFCCATYSQRYNLVIYFSQLTNHQAILNTSFHTVVIVIYAIIGDERLQQCGNACCNCCNSSALNVVCRKSRRVQNTHRR